MCCSGAGSGPGAGVGAGGGVGVGVGEGWGVVVDVVVVVVVVVLEGSDLVVSGGIGEGATVWVLFLYSTGVALVFSFCTLGMERGMGIRTVFSVDTSPLEPVGGRTYNHK